MTRTSTSGSTSKRRRGIPRDRVPPTACLCDYCRASCCQYFSLPIERPETAAEYVRYEWYLEHPLTQIYVSEGVWHLLVETRCVYLKSDYRCGIYQERPEICRDYSTSDCEYVDGWDFSLSFQSPGQLRIHAERILANARGPVRFPEVGFGRPDPVPFSAAYVHELEPPESWEDYDALRWFLAHDLSLIHNDVDQQRWWLYVLNSARPIQPIAPGLLFLRPEQIWDYAHLVLGQPRRRRASLPDLGSAIVQIGTTP